MVLYNDETLNIESVWGRLGNAANANARPTLFFRVVQPAHVHFIITAGSWEHEFDTPGDSSQPRNPSRYRISVEQYPNMILPLNPATLAMKGVSDIELDLLRDEADAKLATWRSMHDDPSTPHSPLTSPPPSDARIIAMDLNKPDWVRLVLNNMEAAEWMCQQSFTFANITSGRGNDGRYHFVYSLNDRALRTEEEDARNDVRNEARRTREAQEQTSVQATQMAKQLAGVQRENAAMRRDQASDPSPRATLMSSFPTPTTHPCCLPNTPLATIPPARLPQPCLTKTQANLLSYVSDAVGSVLANQNAIVTNFAQFTTCQIELSSVDSEIASLRATVSATRQQISQDGFQIAMLQITAGDKAGPAIAALNTKIATAEQELKDNELRLQTEMTRKRGIQTLPSLTLPATTPTAPRLLPALADTSDTTPARASLADIPAHTPADAPSEATPVPNAAAPHAEASATPTGPDPATRSSSSTAPPVNPTPQVTATPTPQITNPTTTPTPRSQNPGKMAFKPNVQAANAKRARRNAPASSSVSQHKPRHTITDTPTVTCLCLADDLPDSRIIRSHTSFSSPPCTLPPPSNPTLHSVCTSSRIHASEPIKPPFTPLLVALVVYLCGVTMTRATHACIPGTINPALVLLLIALCPTTTARRETLRVVTLNCTFLRASHLAKLDALTDLIDRLRPHLVLLTELGLVAGAAFPWSHRNYECHLWPAAHANLNSLSLAILRRRDVSLVAPAQIPNHSAIDGRLAAIDIAFEGLNSSLHTIRIVAAYGPTSDEQAYTSLQRRQFWSQLTAFLRTTPRWILGGDFNISLHRWEHTGYNPDYARHFPRQAQPYLDLLHSTGARDAWHHQNRVYANRDWTFRDTGSARRIIDRFATPPALSVTNIRTYQHDIPGTAHRPVIADIAIDALIPSHHAHRNRAPTRYIRPSGSTAASRFSRFQASLADKLPAAVHENPISSDAHFDDTLATCDTALQHACRVSFHKKRPRSANPALFTRPTDEVQQLLRRLKTARSIVRAIDTGELHNKLRDPIAAAEWTLIDQHRQPDTNDLAAARHHRNHVLTAIRKARWNPNYVPSPEDLTKAYRSALKGGPIKHLFSPGHITNPPVLRLPDSPEGEPRVCSTPTAKLQRWTQHFSQLLSQAPIANADAPAPWLTCSAARTFQQSTRDTGITWPKPMTIEDLHRVLRKGNQKPSPGPDGWEKWAVRAATPAFLETILLLCNYSIVHNYFPPRLKQNYISPLYKRGDAMQPDNYRAVVFANCLHNIIMSWFAMFLQETAWDLTYLPPTQVATQRLCQSGDLMHFLAQVDVASRLTDTTIFAIKRDHVKGFDFLSPLAFQHAVNFFGLPPSVITFDTSRTTDVSLRVKTQDGVGTPFYTTGQTKQGDPASPIKYTLTMAMLYHWLKSSHRTSDFPRLRTLTAHRRAYHTRADTLSLRLISVEAMDDSIFFASSWDALSRIVHQCEEFQSTYGIMTAWDSADKTVAFTLGAPPPGEERDHIAVATPEGPKRVPTTGTPRILRTAIDNPNDMLQRILTVVRDFPLPAGADLPFALINRACWGLLLPKIRAYLTLQPLTPAMAQQVDIAITRKVAGCIHAEPTLSPILTLPIDRHGFAFPSIFRINAEVAIASILRPLNHHLTPFRNIAEITLANWSCNRSHGKCHPPLERPHTGLHPEGSLPRRWTPSSWASAHQYLQWANMSLIETNQSYLLTRASLQHILNRTSHLGHYPPARGDADFYQPVPQLIESLRTALRTDRRSGETARRVALLTWLKSLNLPDMLTTLDRSLLTSKDERTTTLLSTLSMGIKPTARYADAPVWATDGSHHRASANRITPSTTAAVVGPHCGAFKLTGQDYNPGHGELIAVIAATLASRRPDMPDRIITDYLSAVRAAAEITVPGWQEGKLKPRRQGELYQVMARLIHHSEHPPVISHIKAHTDADDLDSRLNAAVDHLAKEAHDSPNATLVGPTTSWMTRFVPYHPTTGYAPDTWTDVLDAALVTHQLRTAPANTQRRLTAYDIHQPTPTPRYFYTNTPSKFLAKTQYLARAGLLRSDYTDWCKRQVDSPECTLCGAEIGDLQHLFLHCQAVHTVRTDALAQSRERLRSRLCAEGDAQAHTARLDAWSQYLEHMLAPRAPQEPHLQYWLGLVPPTHPPLLPADRLTAHEFAITLTARIYGRWVAEWTRRRNLWQASAATPRPRPDDRPDDDDDPDHDTGHDHDTAHDHDINPDHDPDHDHQDGDTHLPGARDPSPTSRSPASAPNTADAPADAPHRSDGQDDSHPLPRSPSPEVVPYRGRGRGRKRKALFFAQAPPTDHWMVNAEAGPSRKRKRGDEGETQRVDGASRTT
ncbi:hypothetical protein JCM24511_03480 [Saitozyma sp. JCM 24511]|nr:hypothetical protein JCM24511_03480 [Saitozyma sp. JCM 24511]